MFKLIKLYALHNYSFIHIKYTSVKFVFKSVVHGTGGVTPFQHSSMLWALIKLACCFMETHEPVLISVSVGGTREAAGEDHRFREYEA